MFHTQLLFLSAFAFIITKEDWVEIPQVLSFPNSTKVTGETFPDFSTESTENYEYYTTNSPTINKRILSEDLPRNKKIKTNNRITMTAAKSSIIFSSSSTTEFTPLESSVSVAMTNPVTTPTPRTKKSKKKIQKEKDDIEIEDVPDEYVINDPDEKEENKFNSYFGFMPFIRSIQSTLFQKAHKTVKSKIDILKNLRDNLLFEIDQRIKNLWATDRSESTPREYKGESHMDFPSNESALMTIGFLTLATFLVKLILKLIAAIKAKHQPATTTTTMASMMLPGRKKRSESEDFNVDATYRILNLIDSYKVNNFDHN